MTAGGDEAGPRPELRIVGATGTGKTYLSALYAVNEARQQRRVLWEGVDQPAVDVAIKMCQRLATDLALRPYFLGGELRLYSGVGSIRFAIGPTGDLGGYYDTHILDDIDPEYRKDAGRMLTTIRKIT